MAKFGKVSVKLGKFLVRSLRDRKEMPQVLFVFSSRKLWFIFSIIKLFLGAAYLYAGTSTFRNVCLCVCLSVPHFETGSINI